MKKCIVFLACFCLLFTSYAFAGKNFKGQKAPLLTASKWLNTQPLSLSNTKGKVVLLEFFSIG